ncbi:hypothetical protein, variant [Puccinia triticina 1-1 BBBD Race 1]|uniref:Zn(2)-C6 fungal-type domain-containing protein n=1 Tax=Puccinia triticina (isolate 1-1 / race 1 (BBBD)) TaxID=630390 RepID=A0A180H3X2_PUCT1|nr:hypothetical protein PTTG_02399 [Puccinia triticina 1-1 BBBD Race 1]OAV99064.1 hypothetical protein, variant [Puccinia triticina 1-1 BBBD Race 1]
MMSSQLPPNQLPPNLAEDDLHASAQAEHQPQMASTSAQDFIFIDPSNRFLPMPTRKKKRVFTSCRQCRKRRCACSRELPCFACVSRGEGDQCDWTGASPQFIKSKGQVHRDHFLSRQENPARLRIQQDIQALDTRVEYLLDLVKQHTPSSTAAVTKPEIVPVTNYHVDDIATQLSRFTLNQAIPQLPIERPLSNPNAQISVKEVEEYAQEEERKAKPAVFTFNMGSGSPVTPPGLNKQNLVSSSTTSPILQGLLGIGKGPTTFEGIMAELPNCIQIKACLEQFEYHRAWMRTWIFNNLFRNAVMIPDYQLSMLLSRNKLFGSWQLSLSAVTIKSQASNPIQATDDFLFSVNGETLGLALDFIGKAIDLSMKIDLFSGLELPLDQFDEDFDSVDGHLKTPRAPRSTHTIMTGINHTNYFLSSVATGAMLAIHRAELFPLDNVPIQFFVLSATISLAVYCLTNNSSDEDEKCHIVADELKKPQNLGPAASFTSSPCFQGVPQTFDFGNLFDLHSAESAAATTSTPQHTTSGNNSDGSSATYLSTPSSATNQLLSSMFNNQELNSSPTSLNPPTTSFPFGVGFDNPQNPASPFAELPYPVTHQPVINSRNVSGGVPGAVDSSLDGSFINGQLAARNLSTAGYPLSSQFDLPVTNSIT